MTGAEFKQTRRALGLSIYDMADLLQLGSERSISRWETGERPIPGSVQVLLRVLLGVPEARRFLDLRTQRN